MTEDLD